MFVWNGRWGRLRSRVVMGGSREMFWRGGEGGGEYAWGFFRGCREGGRKEK